MGRNLKERKAALEEAKLSRRKFLKIGGAVVVAAGVGLWKPWASRPKLDEWAFLDRKIILPGKNADWCDIVKQTIPLQPEMDMNADSLEYQELIDRSRSAVNKEVNRRGWRRASTLVTKQAHGKPEAPEFAEPYKDYLEQAIGYLYSRIPQLARLPLDLTVLKKGQDFSSIKSGKAFVGYSLHDIQRLYVTNEDNGERFMNAQSSNHDGSMCHVNYDNKDSIEGYYLFFGTGPLALCSAFSEVIPWTTNNTPGSKEHFKKRGFARHQLTEETISEGISYILGEEVIKEFDIPNGGERLKRARKEMEEHVIKERKAGRESRYRLVDASERWLKKNGIDSGLELYAEDPEKYLDACKGLIL